MHEASFYTLLKDNKVQCQLCNHFCAISPNKVGICNARKNVDGKLYSLVYGKPISIHVDPIEKKPIYDFLPNTNTLSFGTLGCNLRCANCHNFDISQANPLEEISKSLEFVKPEDIVKMAFQYGCPSISYTYNEPTIFTEYALDIMKIARENKLKNIWVSNGFMSNDCLDAILPYLDAANIDLKSIDDEFYKKNAGARVAPILENLKRIKKAGVHLEITTLIIPTLSDEPKMLEKIAKFIAKELGTDTHWHLSRFSPSISWKLQNLNPTDVKTLKEAEKIGKKEGLINIYLDNI